MGPHPLPRLHDGEIEVPVIVTVELLHRLRGESVQLRQQVASRILEIIFVPSENICNNTGGFQWHLCQTGFDDLPRAENVTLRHVSQCLSSLHLPPENKIMMYFASHLSLGVFVYFLIFLNIGHGHLVSCMQEYFP